MLYIAVYGVHVCMPVIMLTSEDHMLLDLAVFYILVGLDHYVGSRSSEDHEPLYSPYKYVHTHTHKS